MIEHMFDVGAISVDELEVIPRELDEMEPGPFLDAILAHTDVSRLSGFDRVTVLRARQRMASHYQAMLYADMAAIAEAVEELDGSENPEMVAEGAAAEIRVALRLTRRTADAELAMALDLRQRLPHLFDAFVTGDLDLRRVRTIVYGTGHLDDLTSRRVVDQILEQASHLTTGQLKSALARLCIEVDPEQAKTRFERAVEERRVVTEMSEQGTGHLFGMDLPPDQVAAASAHINRLAQSLKQDGEARTMDQLRADVYLDLLRGINSGTSQKPAGVEIRVDLTTLTELSENPGELAGYGPVIADIARQTAGRQQDGQWRFVVTDTHTGLPVSHGTTRRRPTATQQRHVEVHNPVCVFPGCRMPAVSCDLDHRNPWSRGGPTEVENLAPLCRHDHRIRHQHSWTHQPLAQGDHQWTTKLGHTFTTSGRPP